MPLIELELPIDIDSPIPDELRVWLDDARLQIQAFQDRWDRRPVEQYVACDFEFVYQALVAIRERQIVLGNRFCEWGCGFAVVSCLAAELDWDVIGIEAEISLIHEAESLVQNMGASVELFHGNFLPDDSEELSDDPSLPSLGHAEDCAYDELGLGVDDFDLIYAYPWPGEGGFLESVFEKHAEPGACFLTFVGPYELRLVRKVSSSKRS